MKRLLKRMNLIKKYFFKHDKFPYPTKDLEKVLKDSNDKRGFEALKQKLFQYWDKIASLALGDILNYIYDDQKREDVKVELTEQDLTLLQGINLEEYEGLNDTYVVFETTRSMLMDLIEDYENNNL